MKLSTKQDLGDVLTRWDHFWQGELYTRPVVVMTAMKEGGKTENLSNIARSRYYYALEGLWEKRLAQIDRWLEQVSFPGEKIPCFSPDFGPDQWAAFFGAELQFSDSSPNTNWVEPVIEDWEEALPLKFKPENRTFQKLLDYSKCLARHGEGRYLVGHIDAHSNADALSALRGPQRFLMDLYDCPELVERALLDMRKSYAPLHKAIENAGGMGGDRGFAHYGFWHSQSFQVVQSDVICMIGQDHFRKLILPALEEEMACHDRGYFHLDGPDALRHLDDILAIPGYWVLQWVPGNGQKPNWQWLDVLKKAQQAGKAVQVFGRGLNLDTIKPLHKELDPARTVYSPDMQSEAEAAKIIKWLEENT